MINNVGLSITIVFYLEEVKNDDVTARIVWEVNGGYPKSVLCDRDRDTVYLIKDINHKIIAYQYLGENFASEYDLLDYVRTNFKVHSE